MQNHNQTHAFNQSRDIRNSVGTQSDQPQVMKNTRNQTESIANADIRSGSQSEVSLKNISDHDLLASTEKAIVRERELTKYLLLHFREIEDRRLYAARGFSSLHDMLVKKWGYSSSSAWRRVQAMRLLKAVPEAAASLRSGEVNLTTLAKAQSVIRAEQKVTKRPVTAELKKKAIAAIKNKSERESEKDLFSIFTAAATQPKEISKRVSETATEITFSASDETLNALKRLKEIWAAKNPQMTWSELIAMMATDCVERHDPVLKTKRTEEKKARALELAQISQIKDYTKTELSADGHRLRAKLPSVGRTQNSASALDRTIGKSPSHLMTRNSNLNLKSQLASRSEQSENEKTNSRTHTETMPSRSTGMKFSGSRLNSASNDSGSENRVAIGCQKPERDTNNNKKPNFHPRPYRSYIPARAKQALYQKSNGQCEYRDPITGKRCDCRYGLEIDHIRPIACGGSNDVWNLRHLCRTHNLLMAEKNLGLLKMHTSLTRSC